MPLVSVVLTTYNRSEALGQTVETVLAQSLTDFELLICDDASTDDTRLVAERYAAADRRVIFHSNPKNLRMPGNLNAGILRAQGKYVANLHDGDIYDPKLLEKWTGALERHPSAAFVFNQYLALNDDGSVRTIYTEDLPELTPGKRLLEDLFFKRWRFDSPVWGTVMARRSAYIEAGLFDARFSFISDVAMWMKLAENYDVAYVAEPLISLPGRDALPRKWFIREDELIHRMFWEARMRHYAGRPVQRLLEGTKHTSFIVGSQAYHGACRLKAALTGGRNTAHESAH